MKNFFKELFRIDGEVAPLVAAFISAFGWVLILFIWWLIPTMKWIDPIILPPPDEVAKAYLVLWSEKNLVFNALFSILVNASGYMWAIIIAVPLGFLAALIPFFRHLISKQMEAIRFTPLPAATGLFMGIFGVGLNVKVQFLAFGIFVYLLPAIIQRIDEIKTDDHLKALYKTMKTLNANRWHMMKHFYLPSVLSRFFPDVINLVAVSWTYIVIVELVNAQGGLGYLIYLARTRSGNTEQIYAVLILIIFIGFVQDRLLKKLDKRLFKFKYA